MPRKEVARATPLLLQYASNLSHIFSHFACEFPFLPTSAMKVAAPSPLAATAIAIFTKNMSLHLVLELLIYKQTQNFMLTTDSS